jgi:LysM repeat protein
MNKSALRRLCQAAPLALLFLVAPAFGTPELAPNAPERYTVKPGDTLWGIASRFLRDPWRWPEIWQANPDIANPHLIYPGDVLVLADGRLRALRRETVKLSPQVRSEPFAEAIPTIPPSAIAPYLSAPLVVEDATLGRAGYVAAAIDNRVVLGKYVHFYARGLAEPVGDIYQIFRPDKPLADPCTGEQLGLLALHVGDARVVHDFGSACCPGASNGKDGERSVKMQITRSFIEIEPGDRLVPAPKKPADLSFLPRAPQMGGVCARVIDAPRGVRETGKYDVVALSVGSRNGIEPGHVLRILQAGQLARDPITNKVFEAPQEPAGLAMVFRTFERVSFALVMESQRPIDIGFSVEKP